MNFSRKNRNRFFTFSILITMLAAFGFGCASKSAINISTSSPAWVEKGSGAFEDAELGRIFYGVGAVTGIRNKPLARTTADNRARAEIARTFETYTASLMKDYMASTIGGATVDSESASSEEQHVEQAIKTFSAVTLHGVIIIDHWTDPSDGTVYSLAKLDLQAFTNSLDRAAELNSKVKEYVKANAEKSFDALEAEEEKRK